MSDTKELIDAGFAQILDAVNADDPKREVFIRVRDLRKETADSFSLLRRQVEELEAALVLIASHEGVPAAKGHRSIITKLVNIAKAALPTSSSLQDERERAAREEERERRAPEVWRLLPVEPTPEMQIEGAKVERACALNSAEYRAGNVYRYMVAAAIRSSTERTG